MTIWTQIKHVTAMPWRAKNTSDACTCNRKQRGSAEGVVEACRYHFPEGQRTPESAHKDCWAWCAHTASEAHAHVSLLHSRVPAEEHAQ